MAEFLATIYNRVSHLMGYDSQGGHGPAFQEACRLSDN